MKMKLKKNRYYQRKHNKTEKAKRQHIYKLKWHSPLHQAVTNVKSK